MFRGLENCSEGSNNWIRKFITRNFSIECGSRSVRETQVTTTAQPGANLQYWTTAQEIRDSAMASRFIDAPIEFNEYFKIIVSAYWNEFRSTEFHSASKFSTTTVDNFVDYSSWCRGDQPQMHVSADRLNSRHRKFINGHDLQTTRVFSGMGHSRERAEPSANCFSISVTSGIYPQRLGRRTRGCCNLPTETILSAGFPAHQNVSRAMSGFEIHPMTCYSRVNFQ